MTAKLTINGLLPNFNDYSGAERKHPKAAARMKKDVEEFIIWHIRQQLRGVRFNRPVRLNYLWVEKDRRRDKDNIAAAQKFVQDALVKAHVLHDDGWNYIEDFTHSFVVDKEQPRVEITISEVGKQRINFSMAKDVTHEQHRTNSGEKEAVFAKKTAPPYTK